ncbi:MAG: hypothetical protein ABMA01_24830 [Chthoniobacteraceae bacterium]
MKPLIPLIPVLAALALVACNDPRSAATARLRKSSVADLRTDAARLHTQFFSAVTQEHFPLFQFHWPESAKKLKPIRMNLYRDGLAIALRQEPGAEFGLHIVPRGITDPPLPTPYIEYERIEDGVYSYVLKR